MVRYLFYTIGDLTYQSPLVRCFNSGWYRISVQHTSDHKPPPLQEATSVIPHESSPIQRSNHSEELPTYKYVNIFLSVIAVNYLSCEIQPSMLLQPIRIPYTFLRRKSILRFLIPSFYSTFFWMKTAKRCLSECNLPFSIFRLKERRRCTYAIIYKVLAITELLPHCDGEATTFPVRR